MTDLDERLAALPPEKRALFESLLQQRTGEQVFPISVIQQGMWFLEQLRPHNPAYVVPGAVRIRGAIDRGVLLDALRDIVRRHETLRTVFQLRDGEPSQLVRAEVDVELPDIDLRHERLTDDELQERIITVALAEPLDVAEGPLSRFALIRTGERESVLVVAMHHLITDGWSMGVLLSELSQAYAALAQGRPSPLPELDVQYGDFATWQRQRAADGSWQEALDYWTEHLHGAPSALDLPTDRPRPATQGFRGGSAPVELPDPLVAELSRLAKQHGATTYMALIAVLQVLLHRYSGQDDIVVGVPTAVRDRAELEPLIGYLVNTLPIRVVLDRRSGFGAVLEAARDACVGGYAHQEVPFETIVTHRNTPRDLSRSPIYQVSCSYAREPVSRVRMGDAELERLTPRLRGARFDLELQVFDNAGSLTAWFEYDRDLFDHATVERMAAHLRVLAEAVVADPGAAIGTLPLFGAEQRRKLLADAGDTAREWPSRGWIHEEVERQARLTPDAPAVRFEDQTVTYAELNARANRLARHLGRRGVDRGDLVGVCLERSVDLVVALLAVVKAGGAYVPLDPGYPRTRLEHMVTDAGMGVVLTESRLWESLDLRASPGDVLALDELAGELAADTPDDLALPLTGDDAAYVIYTSGSTGKPKGVVNVHAAIRNRLLWMQDEYGLDHTDRVLQKTPFSFDVSVWEFWWPLMTGATLVVARPEGHKDAAYLTEVIRRERVTTCHFVPSMLQVFLAEPVSECTSLRRVVCSGEALPREAVTRFYALSDAELHNLYGPTEAAVDVTAHHCARDEEGAVPIGVPIANTAAYVLDAYLQPVPPGVTGELYLGGRNLARGYWRRPGLSAERFIAHPHASRAGERLYRTGDLARWRSDGTIEFLGRSDGQVKLRGFRIELGEIEAALQEHEHVKQAAVLAAEGGDGGRLHAYVVPGAQPPRLDSLTTHLKRSLPDYMVPSAFSTLPELPLNPSGKLDRAALSALGVEQLSPETVYVAPTHELERDVARLWASLLGVDRVGIHDNFFDLGGNSLLMSRLRSGLADELGRTLPMVELFRNPTVASLAAHLSGEGGSDAAESGQQRAKTREQSRNLRRELAQRRMRSRKREEF